MRTCVLLVMVISLSLARPALGRTLRVLTYNIHHSEGRDFAFDLERIASIISSANPDIVALQELDHGNSRSGLDVFQLDRLAELTGLQGYFGKTISFAGGEYGNGVLVSPSIAITRAINHPLPSPAGGEARAAIELGLSFADMGITTDITFFATHFHHTNNDTNRFAQAGFVNNLMANATTPALLAGDLNARPWERTMQRMLEQWTDTTDLVNSGISRTSQIDYALFRHEDQWDVIEAGHFIVNPTTAVASDHYPLLTVVEVVPEPSTLTLLGSTVLIGAATWLVQRRRETKSITGSHSHCSAHRRFSMKADSARPASHRSAVELPLGTASSFAPPG